MLLSKLFRPGFLMSLITLSTVAASAQYKIYEKGFESYKAGDFQASIANFSEFLTKPTREKALDVEVYYLRGLCYYKSKDYKNSVADFQEALLLNHSNRGNIFWFLAKSNENLGFYPDALDALENAIKEFQSDKENLVKLHYERGLIYLKMEDKALAYQALKKAYDIQPGNTQVKSELGKFSPQEVAELTRSTQVPSRKEPSVKNDSIARNVLADFYRNEKRYALVIGNSQYPKKIGELKNPVNDATDMAAELEKSNFEVQLLTDATYGQIRAALLKFKEKLDRGNRDETVALFYFAGHALYHQNENYLVPVDAQIEYEDDIWRYCFPVQRMVLSNMEMSNSRMNIVILDACRSNPFPSLTRSAGQQGLGEMKDARGSFIAYATAPGSVASDGTGRNGLYTQEILKAIRKPALTIEQVFKEVRLNVLRLSGDKQNTWDSSNITGEFYFKF